MYAQAAPSFVHFCGSKATAIHPHLLSFGYNIYALFFFVFLLPHIWNCAHQRQTSPKQVLGQNLVILRQELQKKKSKPPVNLPVKHQVCYKVYRLFFLLHFYFISADTTKLKVPRYLCDYFTGRATPLAREV